MRRTLRPVVLALAVLPLLSVAITLAPRRGEGVPLYAARQGLMCQTCHFDPNGGGPRNDFGFAYARNRHSLEPDTTGAWKDLNLSNKVGDTFPLYVSANERFMAFTNQQLAGKGVDRAGFFNMETAVHLAFQPHPRLTLVYSLEGTAFNPPLTPHDAYGLITLPAGFYLKAGQFRTPFGLRMDDHTVATRAGFLDFESQQMFLPFDPRSVDQGVELGASHGDWFGRASLTNGTDNLFDPLGRTHAQAGAGKLGFNSTHGQVAVMAYDDWTQPIAPVFAERTSRWGAYGLTHAGALALLGELDAGTDAFPSPGPGEPKVRQNKLAAFAEADFAPERQYNIRVRYDRMELDRSTDSATRDLNSYNRYALEGEWVPVPFAEIRWALRLIDPVASKDPLGAEIKNEKQYYVQFHFSY